jgi:hypothetical protein
MQGDLPFVTERASIWLMHSRIHDLEADKW